MIKSRRIAFVLRVIGIILIIAALLLSIIALSTSGNMWKEMDGKLMNSGVSTSTIERSRFMNSYFDTLRSIAAEPDADVNRKREISSLQFAWCEEKATEQEKKNLFRNAENTYAFFTESPDFNAAAWIERFEKTDELQNEKRLNEAMTWLEAQMPPQKGKGKGKAKQANVKEEYEKKYQSLVAEHGEEEVGDYTDFCETMMSLLKKSKEAGGNDNSVTFLTSFEYDDYRAALEVLRGEEREEQAENLMDLFAPYVQQRIGNEPVNFGEFFEKAYERTCQAHEGEEVPEYIYFVPALSSCLQRSNFFGDTADVLKESVSYRNKVQGGAFSKTIVVFHSNMAAEADKAGTGLVELYWFFARYVGVLWIAGILLVIVSILMDKLRIARQIANYKAEKVEMDGDVLLKVDHLCQYFAKGAVKAVDDVSFEVKKGEVFGLVGESGCGKTTTGRSIIKLYDITSGNIYFKGKRIAAGTKSYYDRIAQLKEERKTASPERKAEIRREIGEQKEAAAAARFDHDYCDKTHAHDLENEVDAKYQKLLEDKHSPEELAKLKEAWRKEKKIAKKQNYITQIQMIFQDPVASLDPRMTVRETIAEGLRIRGENDQEEIDRKVYKVLETVGLVREHAGRYPHEFSGGQKQRIGVARAVVMNPEMIIADEPVSALDVSIQAQVINLLDELRHTMGLTIMFIAHDLSVVKYFSDRIGVMYYGHMVELATSDELFAHPLHPYTRSLLSAIPLPDPEYEKDRKRIKYDPHTAHDYSKEGPTLREIAPGHFVSCNSDEFEQYKKELDL